MRFGLSLSQSATASAARPDKDSQTSAGAVAYSEHLTDPDKDSQVGAVASEHWISFRWIPTC